jgi:hypothetical protein
MYYLSKARYGDFSCSYSITSVEAVSYALRANEIRLDSYHVSRTVAGGTIALLGRARHVASRFFTTVPSYPECVAGLGYVNFESKSRSKRLDNGLNQVGGRRERSSRSFLGG